MSQDALKKRTLYKDRHRSLQLKAKLASLAFIGGLLFLLIALCLGNLIPSVLSFVMSGLLVAVGAVGRFRVAPELKQTGRLLNDLEEEILADDELAAPGSDQQEKFDRDRAKRTVLLERRKALQSWIIRSAVILILALLTLIPLFFFAWLTPLAAADGEEGFYLFFGGCCATILVPSFVALVNLARIIRSFPRWEETQHMLRILDE